jgi:tripartite-type tricarboxylate transporter receptor subunit TctC
MQQWMKSAGAVCAALACAAGLSARAQSDYPNKSIRLIVPFAPGGGTDIVARVLAQRLSESFKQSVVVDNRGGAGGLIGMELAVRAAPDGYTFGFFSGSLSTNAASGKLTFDPIRDVTPISMVAESGYVIALNPSLPIRNMKEFLAYAKANPGKLTYGSSGIGSTSHLAGEQLDLLAKIQTTHVPYKSSGLAMTDMLGGQISFIYGSLPLIAPYVSGGRVRIVSITTAKRSSALPDVPTIAESGVPGYETVTWYAVLGPRGLPKNVVARWATEMKQALESKEMKDRAKVEGLDLSEPGPAYLLDVLKRDIPKWTQVVKAANLKL